MNIHEFAKAYAGVVEEPGKVTFYPGIFYIFHLEPTNYVTLYAPSAKWEEEEDVLLLRGKRIYCRPGRIILHDEVDRTIVADFILGEDGKVTAVCGEVEKIQNKPNNH